MPHCLTLPRLPSQPRQCEEVRQSLLERGRNARHTACHLGFSMRHSPQQHCISTAPSAPRTRLFMAGSSRKPTSSKLTGSASFGARPTMLPPLMDVFGPPLALARTVTVGRLAHGCRPLRTGGAVLARPPAMALHARISRESCTAVGGARDPAGQQAARLLCQGDSS